MRLLIEQRFIYFHYARHIMDIPSMCGEWVPTLARVFYFAHVRYSTTRGGDLVAVLLPAVARRGRWYRLWRFFQPNSFLKMRAATQHAVATTIR